MNSRPQPGHAVVINITCFIHQRIARQQLAYVSIKTEIMSSLFRRSATAVGYQRAFSTSLRLQASGATEASVPNSRWLADLRKRLNDLQSKDLSSTHTKEVQRYLALLNEKWLDLSAGQLGYLTEPRWRGLDRHSLFWGDMVSNRRFISASM